MTHFKKKKTIYHHFLIAIALFKESRIQVTQRQDLFTVLVC